LKQLMNSLAHTRFIFVYSWSYPEFSP